MIPLARSISDVLLVMFPKEGGVIARTVPLRVGDLKVVEHTPQVFSWVCKPIFLADCDCWVQQLSHRESKLLNLNN